MNAIPHLTNSQTNPYTNTILTIQSSIHRARCQTRNPLSMNLLHWIQRQIQDLTPIPSHWVQSSNTEHYITNSIALDTSPNTEHSIACPVALVTSPNTDSQNSDSVTMITSKHRSPRHKLHCTGRTTKHEAFIRSLRSTRTCFIRSTNHLIDTRNKIPLTRLSRSDSRRHPHRHCQTWGQNRLHKTIV